MNDPYRILGVPYSASEEEIKNAYKSLMQQYAGDDRKIEEFTKAFDAIMNMRRGGFEQSAANGFSAIRYQIQNGNYNDADSMLDSMTDRTAEWHFLKGSVFYAKGWLNEAYTHFSQASSMEPYNQEYASAFRHMSENKKGFMKGNPADNPFGDNGNPNFVGCNACDICNGLICADCCCECMGGDLIGCC